MGNSNGVLPPFNSSSTGDDSLDPADLLSSGIPENAVSRRSSLPRSATAAASAAASAGPSPAAAEPPRRHGGGGAGRRSGGGGAARNDPVIEDSQDPNTKTDNDLVDSSRPKNWKKVQKQIKVNSFWAIFDDILPISYSKLSK